MKRILILMVLVITAVGCGKKEEASSVAVTAEPTITIEQFMQAALNGQEDIIKNAIDLKLDVNVPGPEDRTAIMLAAFNGHSKVVNLLAEAGAKVDTKDSTGRTALMYASTGTDAATVVSLLKYGSKVNDVDGGEHFTPLMWAAAEGNAEICDILLEAGADVNMKDVDGDTAGSFAGKNNHTEIAKKLKALEK